MLVRARSFFSCAASSLIALAGCDATPPDASPMDASPADATDALPVENDASASPWRSALYPEDWTPAHTVDGGPSAGGFLHDFSYAGYHYGERPLGALGPTESVDVVARFGADATGASDSTLAAQAAIDSIATSGGVVYFPAGLYRFDGVLSITHDKTVLRGAGADASRLYFTRSKGMGSLGHITFAGALQSDLELPLVTDGKSRVREIAVADAGSLAVGDDVSVGFVITPELIAEHGMTGTWTNDAFHDTWQTFFRRTVVAIDRTATPVRITLDVPLRYPAKVRDKASLRRERGYLREVGMEALGLSNAVPLADAWAQSQVTAVRFDFVSDAWVKGVRSFASPLSPTTGAAKGAHLQSGGLTIIGSKRMTVADSRLELAENKGGGGNGYLFEMRQSSELLFRDLVARRGRHNFIQNWGFGNTGCVWLRVHSADSLQESTLATAGLGVTCYSDFHHSLATANLIDSSTFDDGMKIVNRGSESTYAGHTGTENVLWNSAGKGYLHSMQFGRGYVVGTRDLEVVVTPTSLACLGVPTCHDGTAPDDTVEGVGLGATLVPQSLYEDQLARRTKK